MKNENIKVSVVIPIYNVEKYVKESVLSIINQTLKEIEIILVNDGSTDSSLIIIKELAQQDKRIQIISNPNQGLSIARNLGIYRAKGEYIYFFDSDDLLDKETLEICYYKSQLEKLDFLFFDGDVFSEQNLPTGRFNYKRVIKFDDKTYKGIEILNKQLNDNVYSSSVCLNFINRKFLNDIQLYFYPRIIHEDELFTFILYLKAKRVGLYNASFFHRRVRINSIMNSANNVEKSILGYLMVCRELKNISQQIQTTRREKELIDKRISTLLSIAISKLDLENITYRKLIMKEFMKYVCFKQKVKLISPNVYIVLKKLKSLRN